MRIPESAENLIGKVCVCSVGRPAIVTGESYISDQQYGEPQTHVTRSWSGLGLDGKGIWASCNPCVIAESGQDFHDKLISRFDGKMSYHG